MGMLFTAKEKVKPKQTVKGYQLIQTTTAKAHTLAHLGTEITLTSNNNNVVNFGKDSQFELREMQMYPQKVDVSSVLRKEGRIGAEDMVVD